MPDVQLLAMSVSPFDCRPSPSVSTTSEGAKKFWKLCSLLLIQKPVQILLLSNKLRSEVDSFFGQIMTIGTDIDLRKRLVRFAMRRGVSEADADDIAGDVWMRTYLWAQSQSNDTVDIEPRAFVSLKHAIVDFWSSPNRVASKRVAYVLSIPQGPDPIQSWVEDGHEVIGFRSWKGRSPLSNEKHAELDTNLSKFLFGEDGLAGVPPSSLSTRKLITSYLFWAGHPLPREIIVSLIASTSVTSRTMTSLEEHHAVEEAPVPTEDAALHLLALVKNLPFRMRASILMALDSDTYFELHERAKAPLHSAMSDWPPPPPIEEVVFPVDDSALSEKLGVTKGNLHVIRKRARDILHRGFDADPLVVN